MLLEGLELYQKGLYFWSGSISSEFRYMCAKISLFAFLFIRFISCPIRGRVRVADNKQTTHRHYSPKFKYPNSTFLCNCSLPAQTPTQPSLCQSKSCLLTATHIKIQEIFPTPLTPRGDPCTISQCLLQTCTRFPAEGLWLSPTVPKHI